jgi:mono/diheme cytochrome c family protein
MRRAFLISGLVPLCLMAQSHGADVFQKTCSIAYCHGPAGGEGRAPKLVGHHFKESVLRAVVSGGIPKTSMPAFGRD